MQGSQSSRRLLFHGGGEGQLRITRVNGLASSYSARKRGGHVAKAWLRLWPLGCISDIIRITTYKGEVSPYSLGTFLKWKESWHVQSRTSGSIYYVI